jgi:hypothetical protein
MFLTCFLRFLDFFSSSDEESEDDDEDDRERERERERDLEARVVEMFAKRLTAGGAVSVPLCLQSIKIKQRNVNDSSNVFFFFFHNKSHFSLSI